MVCEIRKAPKETAHIIEGQVIRAYKRRGEAEFNKVLHPIPNNKFSPFALYYEHYKENILGKWDPRTRTHYPKGTERPKYIPTKKELALVDRVNEYLASVKDN